MNFEININTKKKIEDMGGLPWSDWRETSSLSLVKTKKAEVIMFKRSQQLLTDFTIN